MRRAGGLLLHTDSHSTGDGQCSRLHPYSSLLLIYDNSGGNNINKPSLVRGTQSLNISLHWNQSGIVHYHLLHSVQHLISQRNRTICKPLGKVEQELTTCPSKQRHARNKADVADFCHCLRTLSLWQFCRLIWLQHFTTFFTMNVQYSLIFITDFWAICLMSILLTAWKKCMPISVCP